MISVAARCASKCFSFLCLGRSYGVAGDGQVHENPEWEKARQALASINKSQSSAKATQANRTTAEVCFHLFMSFIRPAMSMM